MSPLLARNVRGVESWTGWTGWPRALPTPYMLAFRDRFPRHRAPVCGQHGSEQRRGACATLFMLQPFVASSTSVLENPSPVIARCPSHLTCMCDEAWSPRTAPLPGWSVRWSQESAFGSHMPLPTPSDRSKLLQRSANMCRGCLRRARRDSTLRPPSTSTATR